MKFKAGDLVQLTEEHRNYIIGIISEICPTLGWHPTKNELSSLGADQYSCKVVPIGKKTSIQVRAKYLKIYEGE
tara:strand:- start:196 stop:417 length:222 start_codon:yes stop_codon:yes gene_type:complete